MTGLARRAVEARLDPSSLSAITFDFGNTLVPFPGPDLDRVARRTADVACRDLGLAPSAFVEIWEEERARQIVEELPLGREVDMDVRAGRVLARLRGCPAPPPEARWDAQVVARHRRAGEIEAILEAYTAAFVELTPVPPEIGPFLERLARRYRLAILSNWPLTAALERYVTAAGWAASLRAVVVSHTVGAIKPRPVIFETAATALHVPSGPALLHVGDDAGADVAGAAALGWRTAWVCRRPADSRLPLAKPPPDLAPDIVLERVTDLEAALAP